MSLFNHTMAAQECILSKHFLRGHSILFLDFDDGYMDICFLFKLWIYALCSLLLCSPSLMHIHTHTQEKKQEREVKSEKKKNP